jgi:serine protease Do
MTIRRSLAAALLLIVGTSASADTVVLKSGHKVEGEVLKKSDRELVIDIGVDILRIPLDKIQTVSEKDETAAGPVAATVKGDEDGVFLMGSLPVKSVKDLAEEYGEGVVLIETPSGLGSGFIINDRGYCVTNYHVVEQETRITVTIFDRQGTGDLVRKRFEDCRILALNPYFDLALLQIPAKDYKFRTVYFADDAVPKEGESVFAIGSPLGLERSVSQGIVSTRSRNFDGILYIQTTTEINPGNSGGPLFNTRGEVVGVTNMKLIGGEGLGFAIPISYVKHFLRNRDAYAFDEKNPNTGYRYLDPPRRKNPSAQ